MKRYIFAVFAGIWIFFFIADKGASLLSRFAFLRRNPLYLFIDKGVKNIKGLSLFLLILFNIILMIRLFDTKASRHETPERR